MFFIFVCYQIIHILALPIVAGYLILRKIKKKPVFGNFFERIGLAPHGCVSHECVSRIKNKKVIWFHAVSVGEVLSLQAIIEKIKKNSPKTVCYLTVGTITGKKIAQEKLNADVVSFLPFDFLLFMWLAYKRINPSKIIIVEAEIWPNLLMLAHFKKIPVYLINARMSERSKPRYHRFKRILLPLFNIFTKIYTQSEYDKKEFENFGIKEEKLEVLGNIKIHNVLEKHKNFNKKDLFESGLNPPVEGEETVLLAGSIHPGEEEIYLNLYKKLKTKFSNLKIIIAPRHFHWQEELVKKVTETGHSFFIWDEKNKITQEDYKNSDIILVCTLGELFGLYKHADIFYLGGTFVPKGGHNLLEPAVWSTPTIIGPHYFNNTVIAQELIKHNGLMVAQNELELEEKTRELLDAQPVLGKNARAWLEKNNNNKNNFYEETCF